MFYFYLSMRSFIRINFFIEFFLSTFYLQFLFNFYNMFYTLINSLIQIEMVNRKKDFSNLPMFQMHHLLIMWIVVHKTSLGRMCRTSQKDITF